MEKEGLSKAYLHGLSMIGGGVIFFQVGKLLKLSEGLTWLLAVGGVLAGQIISIKVIENVENKTT